jgi:polyhydroxyalkanoate synthesis regulator phasin
MLDDIRKTIEATIGELTPARAKSLAKSMAEPGAAKDQVAKSANELIDWSQKNRDRLKEFIRREVSRQVGAIGVASQTELETLRKRVRALERAAGTSASPKAASKRGAAPAKAAAAKKTTAKKTTAKTTAPRARS